MLQGLCKLFCSSSDSSQVRDDLIAVANGQNPGLLSAACCVPGASSNDEALLQNFQNVLKETGQDNESIRIISITDARKVLPTMQNDLTPSGRRLVAQIQQLVAQNGFGIFPILILNGRIAYFGGVPSTEMIREKLQSDAGVTV